jgi:hypothetical protein
MVNKNSAIKNTGDHNWDMERMQVEKDKGNILTDKDYVNKESKDANTAMGLHKNNNNKNNNNKNNNNKNNKRKVAKTANDKDQ